MNYTITTQTAVPNSNTIATGMSVGKSYSQPESKDVQVSFSYPHSASIALSKSRCTVPVLFNMQNRPSLPNAID